MPLPHFHGGGVVYYYCPFCFFQDIKIVNSYVCECQNCWGLIQKDDVLDKNSMRENKINRLVYEW